MYLSQKYEKNVLDIRGVLGMKYKVLKLLGSGSFGDVYLGQHKKSGDLVAIKCEDIKSNYKVLKNEEISTIISTFKLITGDFWLSKPAGYFMNYKKRGQGISSEFQGKSAKGDRWFTQNSVALSKGKYSNRSVKKLWKAAN